MSKFLSSAPFLALLLTAALASAAIWNRSVETPPWRTGRPEPASDPIPPPVLPLEDENSGFGAFTFLTYNVKNWLVSSQGPEKSPASKEAVIRIIASAAPDVIGLSEVGSGADLAEIRSMLRAEGLDFPHIHHCGGSDPVRHLALLSRFPIVSSQTANPIIPDTAHTMQRGILDATLRIAGRNIRFMGIHLKSKRTVREFDQALLRIAEAGHVRKSISGILAADPGALLVAYGDFNDTTRSLSTRTIYGTYRTAGYMHPIHVSDSRKETWTHRYEEEDVYSRIDFVTVSGALKRHVKRGGSRIIDDSLWNTASDHRPILVRFEWNPE